jgi:hypothetical protein
VLIAAGVIAVTTATLFYLYSQPTTAVACTRLVYVGDASLGDALKPAYLFVNGLNSTCALKAPAVSYITGSGAAVNVRQEWAMGANENALLVEAHKPAAVPYTTSLEECQQDAPYEFVVMNFSSGVTIRAPESGSLCPGSLITVWTPVAAQACADFSYAWSAPNGSGSKHGC